MDDIGGGAGVTYEDRVRQTSVRATYEDRMLAEVKPHMTHDGYQTARMFIRHGWKPFHHGLVLGTLYLRCGDDGIIVHHDGRIEVFATTE